MKNIIIKFTILLGVTLIISACDDYLDIVPKGQQLLETPEDYSQLFNARDIMCYSRSDIASLSDDVWANTAIYTQYFVTGIYTSSNISFFGNPSSINRQQYYTIGSTTSGFFYSCYNRINRVSNIILTSIDNIPGDKALKERTKAEARILRAYNYFMLINVYAKPYNVQTAATDGGVPLSKDFDLTATPRQASVAEIYGFIEEDINIAIESGFLSNQPENTLHPSLAMAYALKAKVHLFKREFDMAKEAALKAYELNNYIFDLVSYVNGGMATKIMADNQENLYYALADGSFTTNGVTNTSISPAFANLFSASQKENDCRFSGFYAIPGTTTPTTTSAAGTDEKDIYTFNATVNITSPATRNVTNYWHNLAGMKTTEVILMIAECYARESNYAKMNEYLDKIKEKRIKNYISNRDNFAPGSSKDAVNIVMTERRKELYLGFHRFFDIRRINADPDLDPITVTRTFPNNPSIATKPQATYTILPTSNLWIAVFPNEEIIRNSNLKNNVPN